MIRYIQKQPIQIQKADHQVKPKSAGKEIVGNFEKMFNEVNKDNVIADKKISEMVAGKSKDISGTIIAMEKADVSTRLLMAVRNKLVSAYEEVMRMQI